MDHKLMPLLHAIGGHRQPGQQLLLLHMARHDPS
jgi:hypothetical protein